MYVLLILEGGREGRVFRGSLLQFIRRCLILLDRFEKSEKRKKQESGREEEEEEGGGGGKSLSSYLFCFCFVCVASCCQNESFEIYMKRIFF